jgi:ribonucleoside-diphosphate reductase alpha chain
MKNFPLMFAHDGKTNKVIGKKRVSIYKRLYNHLGSLQDNNTIKVHENYLNDNELAQNIYSKKYYVKDLNNDLIEDKPEDVFKRLASFLSTVEETPTKQKEFSERFYNEMFEGRFIAGGRVLAGAGDLYRLKTLANCFVSQIDTDDIDSIYKAAFECARTYSYGGGIGVDISCLRPKDAIVHNAADSSTGAVSFMELYSLTTGLIGQSGRRGALMLTIDVKHPDVMHFLKVKKTPNWVTNQIIEQCNWSGLFDEFELDIIKKQVMENTQVRFANISIKVSDEFMSAVDEERKYNSETYLVYLNKKRANSTTANQYEHFSVKMPSKKVDNFELIKTFESFASMKKWLKSEHNQTISKKLVEDVQCRNKFGDYKVTCDDYELAIRQAGDFMLYFKNEDTGEIKQLVKARSIWDEFVEGNYKTAEPGLIFWSTMSDYSPSNYVGRPIVSTNPCAEVPLEDGGACNLGSLNLSRFIIDGYQNNARINWDQLAESTQLLVRFLDNVVTWNEDLNALEKQRLAAKETRRLGLGVMGIADMLNQLGIAYDSDDAIDYLEQVMGFITNAAYQASAMIAKEKEPSPIFNLDGYKECPFYQEALNDETKNLITKNGLRNIAIMSIAPTGSISNIVLGYEINGKNYIGVSGGVEPIFAVSYTRRSESFNKRFKIFHSTVQAYMDLMDIKNSAEEEETLPSYFFRTAHTVVPDKRVKIQGVIQKYIDHSISSTINLPEDVEPEVISDIYFMAWQKKLKGVTIYRDGSRFPILSVDNKLTPFQSYKDKKFEILNEEGEKIEVRGDHVIKNEQGRLTTLYHYMNNLSKTTSTIQKTVSTKEVNNV